METALLTDIVEIAGLAVAVVYICHRIKVPTIIAFLLTGVLAGPKGLGLVSSTHQVEMLAELGVVLLLFTIGLEFSFKELARMKKAMLLGGSVQVFGTIGLIMGIVWLDGVKPGPAAFLGFMAALSSTAIVLKALEVRSTVDSSQGRTSLAILIFQDVAVVAMLICTPLLAGGSPAAVHGGAHSGLELFGRGFLAVLVLAAAAKWGVVKLLDATARRRNQELFVVSIALVLLGVAWLTAWAGLSLALGAFLAGVLVAESQYGAQTVASVLPMRDLFTSLFFVSVGMLLDPAFVWAHPVDVGIVALTLLVVKVLTAGGAARALGHNLRVSLAVGLSLAQVGEFSFVLAKSGMELGLITGQNFQLALAASVITMMLTPGMIWLGEKTAGMPSLVIRNKAKEKEIAKTAAEMDCHVIIVGYGLNGRNVARAAELAGLDYLVVEMNPATVKRESKNGKPVVYGDAVSREVLKHAGLARAKALVITLTDPAATRRIVAASRGVHPNLHIIARTRYLQEVAHLKNLGANQVIPEEYETSLEIFSRVLKHLGISDFEAERMRAQLRSEGYQLFRDEPEAKVRDTLAGRLGSGRIATLRVEPGSPAQGQSLSGLDLRKAHGLNLLAVHREAELITEPEPSLTFAEGDLLVVFGTPEAMEKATNLFWARAGENGNGSCAT